MKSIGGASVGLFFKMLLRENKIDERSVDYIQDLDGKMLGDLFQGGMGDYFVTDNLSALAMTAANPDVVIGMEMVSKGNIPWSVYYRETESITPEFLEAKKKFCVALQKGIDWVLDNDAESFRDELAELFPKVPVDVAVGVANGFRRDGMWTSATVSRDGFERWQVGLADARLVKSPLPYEDVVHSTAPAEA